MSTIACRYPGLGVTRRIFLSDPYQQESRVNAGQPLSTCLTLYISTDDSSRRGVAEAGGSSVQSGAIIVNGVPAASTLVMFDMKAAGRLGTEDLQGITLSIAFEQVANHIFTLRNYYGKPVLLVTDCDTTAARIVDATMRTNCPPWLLEAYDRECVTGLRAVCDGIALNFRLEHDDHHVL